MNVLEHTMLGIDRILNGSPSSSDGQHGRKSAVCGAQQELSGEERPTAGIGTADAGLPIVRYWTVRYEARGRTYFDHVIACDAWKAGLVVFRRHDGATSTQVVREIQLDEYEHLTRKSP